MVDDLKKRYDDRFSNYFNARQLKAFESLTSGRFKGIGLQVSEVDQGLRVAEVYPESPAERAGIERGDVITAVDGKSIAGLAAEVSTAKIRGKPGTTVELKLKLRDGGSRDGRRRARRGPAPGGRRPAREGRRRRDRLRHLPHLLRGCPRRAAPGDRAPVRAGRRGPGARPARQRRRPAQRGRPDREHLRPERRRSSRPRAAPRATAPTTRSVTRSTRSRWRSSSTATRPPRPRSSPRR